MSFISGQTRLAGLFGYPARHSLSPVLHNAAYKAMQLDLLYLVFPVEPKRIEQGVEAIRALDMLGVSVTMPFKEEVIPYLDSLSPHAELLGAVNCIARDGNQLVGHNTDGYGFLKALHTEQGWDPAGKRCVVIGAGGAAKAILAALAEAGAADIAVINRSAERAELACVLAGSAGRVGSEEDIASASLVVNATSVGMECEGVGVDVGLDDLPVAVESITANHVVVDVIYHPKKTRFLEQCEKKGASVANGVGMLVYQAARQIELWTGKHPPVEIMRSALDTNPGT